MNALRLSLAVALLLTGWPALALEPAAIGPYLNGALPETPPGAATGWRTERAFPALTFNSPFQMIRHPTEDRFFVAEKRGRIASFSAAGGGGAAGEGGDKRYHLDIAHQVSQGGGTHGLMGFALHPEFAVPGSPNEGYLYLWYRYIPDPARLTSENESYRRLSRFRIDPETGLADPGEETVLIQQFVRSRIHTGGGMFFGPDGFLYLGVGDEGVCCEQRSTQRIDRWLLSGVLRIDVDRRGGDISHPIRRQPTHNGDLPPGWPPSFSADYFIPDDNPWQDPTGGVLEEFYAIGLRHPYTLSYDPPTGDIWAGDVGEQTWEEIDRVVRGGNYEWPFREADRVHRRGLPYAPERLADVLGERHGHHIKLNRATSNSVIGGFVYRGALYPELQGRYLFADHATGRIFSVDAARPGGMDQDDVALLAVLPECNGGFGIASFATDERGEIYVLKLDGVDVDEPAPDPDPREGGTIHRIVPELGMSPEPPPLLSQVGAFVDLESLTPAPGLIPYGVNVPLWSDGAVKSRWLALPNDGAHDDPSERVEFAVDQPWGFPPGTVAVKHFELPALPGPVRLETRFLVLGEAGVYGVTYRWRDDGSDADLLVEREQRVIEHLDLEGDPTEQTWTFPARTDCLTCHTAAAGRALGVNTQQLNGPYGDEANQLAALDEIGALRPSLADAPDDLPRAFPLDDPRATPTARVFSYLDANCAGCHRPDGVEGAFDARLLASFAEHRLVGRPATAENSVPGGLLVAPGDVAGSELYRRDVSEGGGRMPPVGRDRVDVAYADELAAWIEGLAEPPDHLAPPIGEVGRVEVDSEWTTVELTRPVANPVVVLGGPSLDDGTPAMVQLRDVRPDRFDLRVAPWACDREHGVETVGWLVVEAGLHRLPDGRRLAAGRVDEVADAWTPVDLADPFDQPPAVVVTAAGEGSAVAPRLDALDEAGFEVRVQREQRGPAADPTTVSWIAIEPGADPAGLANEAGTADRVDNTQTHLEFTQRYLNDPIFIAAATSYVDAEPGGLRYRALTGQGARVTYREEQCHDGERTHGEESIAWFVFERAGVLRSERLCAEVEADCDGFDEDCDGVVDEGACPPDPDPDAGVELDAGAGLDAGAELDQGVPHADAAPPDAAQDSTPGPPNPDGGDVHSDATPPDAAQPDAAQPDAAVELDAQVPPNPDGGAPRDAGPALDLGFPNPDAGDVPVDPDATHDAVPTPTDAGPGDAGPPDAGPTDAAPLDAGPPDAEDLPNPSDRGPADAAADANPDAAELDLSTHADARADADPGSETGPNDMTDRGAPSPAHRDAAPPTPDAADGSEAGCACRAGHSGRSGLLILLALGLRLRPPRRRRRLDSEDGRR